MTHPTNFNGPVVHKKITKFIAVITKETDAIPDLLHDAAEIVSSTVSADGTHRLLVVKVVGRDDTVEHIARVQHEKFSAEQYGFVSAQVYNTKKAALGYLNLEGNQAK